ncbi:carbohydrate-binding module family 1 protein [Pleomassaria siparia CBS 279.74]|uniref:AA9 family lytic polysaccharide monooxygenase n=1 Tax=Pleomassaria siparia CBS 279.74 TaxID=1314801 RepID=A0A6G1JY25_9PLEO|nr:carbohydrate-binding module family 1 protein [Pleomassaria siparia CBS 279.74]
MKFSIVATATAILSTSSAHGGVGVYTVGTTAYQGWQPYNSASGQSSIQRQYATFNPLLIADLTTVNIRCNNAGDLGTGPIGAVSAGATLKAKWTQWTHRPAAVMIYMAKCPSSGCNSWDGAGKVWFKIAHAGLISGTQNAGKWAGDQITDTLEWVVTLPASLAAGDYLVRHELLALHQANNPQFYPECAQFTVTGSGTISPDATYLVSFPGAYSASDPGIAFNIDSDAAKTATTYPIPGPAVWNGSESTAPTQPDPPAAPTTLATSVVSAPTTAPPATCSVKKYDQCGGKTYTGCATFSLLGIVDDLPCLCNGIGRV